MRKCCEETLRVLRVHKESLLTIVEVFIHDPLYRWALTPANAHQRQVSSMGDAAAFPGDPLPPSMCTFLGILCACTKESRGRTL
jgi:phosphatidylinositol kinase/protein kinase (PI-3  family)